MITRQRRPNLCRHGGEILRRIVGCSQRLIAVTALLFCTSAGAAVEKGAELTELPFPDATISHAETAPPGSFVPADHPTADSESQAFKTMPAFCHVALVLRPSAD